MLANLKSLMLKATGLTRSGKLLEATAAIQAALMGRIAPHSGSAKKAPTSKTIDVIDVQARDVSPQSPDVRPSPHPSSKPLRRTAAPAPDFVAADASGATGTFTSASHTEPGAGTRSYKLYIPPHSAAATLSGQRLPLVLMLHGCKQNPDDFALGTGMNEAALAQGFYVVYPAQIQKANASNCWNWFEPQHQQRLGGEPQILVGIVREVIATHAVDSQRVYVAGLSAGGAMAATLGQTWGDVFAAVGVHSGLVHGAAKDVVSAFGAMRSGSNGGAVHGNHKGSPAYAKGPALFGKLAELTGMGGLPGRPSADNLFADVASPDTGTGPTSSPSPGTSAMRTPPTIVFHGDRDTTVNAINGEQVIQAANHSAAAITQAPETLQAPTNGRDATRRIYRNAQGDSVTEHWAVHGAGHAWSGGNAKGSYTDSAGPDATAEMVRFFLAQRLST